MLFQKLAIAAALTALTAAQEIEQNDIPQQCTQVCSQVVTIARDCDNRFGIYNIPYRLINTDLLLKTTTTTAKTTVSAPPLTLPPSSPPAKRA